MMPSAERERYLLCAKMPVFCRRLAHSLSVIQQALRQARQPYVSWSGGKDSTVTLALVRSLKPDIKVAFFDSGAEFPDTYRFVEKTATAWDLDLHWVDPPMGMLDLYELVGVWQNKPQMRELHTGELARILIKDPARHMNLSHGCDLAFVGLRAEESPARRKNVGVRGETYECAYDGITHCLPVSQWRTEEVWAYIVSEDLPYNPVYDKAWPGGREAIRVGAYAGSTEGTLSRGRWAFVKRHYPQMWREFVARFPAATKYV